MGPNWRKKKKKEKAMKKSMHGQYAWPGVTEPCRDNTRCRKYRDNVTFGIHTHTLAPQTHQA